MSKDIDKFMDDVIEVFGFLLAQKIALSPLTPKDTNAMAMSFKGTYRFDRGAKEFIFIVPDYTEYVIEGTYKMKARPFVNQILESHGAELLDEAFMIVGKRESVSLG